MMDIRTILGMATREGVVFRLCDPGFGYVGLEYFCIDGPCTSRLDELIFCYRDQIRAHLQEQSVAA